jgi:hypothetical protein
MDPRERIALWVALIVLLVFVLVRSTSSFVGPQMSFVDLAEFDTLPADLKKLYYESMVNGVAKEAGKKVSEMWTSLTPAQKETAKKQAADQAKMVIEQIKSGKGGVMVMPPTQNVMAPQVDYAVKKGYTEPMKMEPQVDYAMKTGYTEPMKMIGTPAPNMEYAKKMEPRVDYAKGVVEPMKMGPQVDYAKGFAEPMKMGTKVDNAKGFMDPMKMGTKVDNAKGFAEPMKMGAPGTIVKNMFGGPATRVEPQVAYAKGFM